ncbi:hypothetical protein CWI38_0947p0010 [Hamiltosporidium tvaerminnensis]|uniref:Reverse transcriptase n=1 Tax=Hamiltosporidium tvaerminnensis TaxID=1176355 RepID=A0A4Q9LTN6_9MICR|nr:hypothetical protein CWI38_0947p0010 [Hamiltosporidium tvaerminnensis]
MLLVQEDGSVYNDVTWAYNRAIHSASNKSAFQPFNDQLVFIIFFFVVFDNGYKRLFSIWELEIDPVIYNEVNKPYYLASYPKTTASEIYKNLETDTEIQKTIRNLLFGDKVLLKGDFDVNTKTKRTPSDSFYDDSVFTVTNIFIGNMIDVSDSSRWLKRGNIRPQNEAVFCYIQDRNEFWGADGVCQHCGKSGKTVDHLATRCEKMLGHDYTRRHNEVVRCLDLLLLNRYKFKSKKRIRSHSVQEILNNEYAEIRVDTRIKTDVKIRNNRPDIFILDKRKNKITLIEVGITSQDSLQIVETEKLRKYDLLANDLGLIYKCSVEIIPYVMTLDGILTKYHKSHLKRLEIPTNVEAYIQSIVLKKTVEIIFFDRRRRLDWERASMCVIMRSEMMQKIKHPLFYKEEPTNNINEESELEEETKVVKEVEETYKNGK